MSNYNKHKRDYVEKTPSWEERRPYRPMDWEKKPFVEKYNPGKPRRPAFEKKKLRCRAEYRNIGA